MSGAPMVWCVQFVARPSERAEGPDDAVGALVNCWVRHEDRDEAVRTAQREVESEGWRVEEMDFVDEVRTRDLSEEARKSYDQAIAEGVCLVFFVWTEDDAEDEDASETAEL